MGGAGAVWKIAGRCIYRAGIFAFESGRTFTPHIYVLVLCAGY